MDPITIHLGKYGLTPSSTFAGGNISPKIELMGVPKDVQYVAMIVQDKSGVEAYKCLWSI